MHCSDAARLKATEFSLKAKTATDDESRTFFIEMRNMWLEYADEYERLSIARDAFCGEIPIPPMRLN
jgi:hypothetical protein